MYLKFTNIDLNALILVTPGPALMYGEVGQRQGPKSGGGP